MLVALYVVVATIVGWLAGGKYTRDRIKLGVSKRNIDMFIADWKSKNVKDGFVVFDKKGYNIFTNKNEM